MDDTSTVECAQRGQHPLRNGHGLGNTERSSTQAIAKRFTFKKLHGDKELAAVLPNLINLANIRMIDACRRSSFAPEASSRRVVFGHRRHRFQRDCAFEPFVPGRIDDTHAAFAQLARNLIVPDAAEQTVSSGMARRV